METSLIILDKKIGFQALSENEEELQPPWPYSIRDIKRKHKVAVAKQNRNGEEKVEKMVDFNFKIGRESEIGQRSTFDFFLPTSTDEPKTTKIPFGRPLPKEKSRKKHGPVPTKIRGSLNLRSAPFACQLDDELTSLVNAVTVV
ncbi:hypothetical protein Adt_06310 [Abeliophyllum distichum]|uniref:Uncharacterized protein n=1 Tax=Abeliophyllum distichum TaxID=126358 RepID=A0ABD1V6J6_9LAMI